MAPDSQPTTTIGTAAASQVTDYVNEWLADARGKLAAGTFTDADLDRLQAAHRRPRRQRLLYLHADTPSIYANLVAAAVHEPAAESRTSIDPLAEDLPYATVQAALVDGWRIIHFPLQRAPFDDREIDVIGYEFILEKLAVYDE